MNVSLTPELEKLVNEKVTSGMYQTASEVIREALRLLQRQSEIQAEKVAALRRDLQVGIDQLEGGDYTEYDEQAIRRLAKAVKAKGVRRISRGKTAV